MFVCHECIGEEFLKDEVFKVGNIAQCSFCGDEAESIALDELSEQVHEIIENYFYQTPSEPEGYEYMLAKEGLWDRDGYPVGDVICDIALVEAGIGEAILEHLSYIYDATGKDALFEEQPYDSDAQYAEKEIDTLELSESWSSFKSDIRSKSRYFNLYAKNVLDQIFQNLDTLVTGDDASVILDMPVNDPNRVIYRARVALSSDQLEKIILGLPKSLGGPPHKHAKSGRMNASGISVFYGALDVDTCITEVRAPVGSSVVVGEFHPVRPLRILDLNRLQKVYVKGSYFDPNHIVELSRAGFLERLVNELSSPVLPGSEEREYLPTQVVAEYWAQLDGLNLDGVMFKSSQVSGNGQNIVLFNGASGIESYELPKGTEVNVSFDIGDPDDDDPTITVWESVPSEEKGAQPEAPSFFPPPMPYDFELSELAEDYPVESTLKLELESVKVHEVQGVKYKCMQVDVQRHRMEKRKYDKF